ncbi:hypothetical protein HY041_00690 [Candidatus Roizmanbacteria bacterium]|nr:hypothetical protein [Candidatus Roizmanbacteria bacterium]
MLLELKYFSIIAFFILFFGLLYIPKTAYAVSYDLIAPTGQLQQGQNVQFTINVDTEGKTLTAGTIGMTYETGPLQYVSTTPGDSFPTVETETQEGGKLIFKASNPNGFSGTGTFAIVTFKIIAKAPGETQLCVLFNPETSPTPPPIQPTALPKTGSTTQTGRGAFLGIMLLVLAGGALIYLNSKPYKNPHHLRTRHKTLH